MALILVADVVDELGVGVAHDGVPVSRPSVEVDLHPDVRVRGRRPAALEGRHQGGAEDRPEEHGEVGVLAEPAVDPPAEDRGERRASREGQPGARRADRQRSLDHKDPTGSTRRTVVRKDALRRDPPDTMRSQSPHACQA